MDSILIYLFVLGVFSFTLALKYSSLSRTLSGFVRNNKSTKIAQLA